MGIGSVMSHGFCRSGWCLNKIAYFCGMENTWDERYATEEYIYGTEPNSWFADKLKILKAGKLLLPAEGEGRNAVWAAHRGWQVTAFDQSMEARLKAERLAAERNVSIQYLTGDLRSFIGEPESFDAIALIYVHMPPNYRNEVHATMIRLLKPGGTLILEAFTKAQLPNKSGGPKNIELLYDPAELKGDFRTMKILEYYHAKVHLQEGILHQGIAEVIRMTARKK